MLVAEDEPGVRELIVRTLQGNGYRVLAAKLLAAVPRALDGT